MSELEMCRKLEEMSREAIESILKNGIQTNDVDILYKLTKINKMTKESEDMYGNYDRYDRDGRYGRDEYGRYDEYGARRRDSRGRYMGHEHLDRMYEEYGRYNDSRQRYGAGNEEADKSFHYMVKALEDFVKVLHSEADTPQEKQMLNETLQRSIM